jgi:hypothetical protein
MQTYFAEQQRHQLAIAALVEQCPDTCSIGSGSDDWSCESDMCDYGYGEERDVTAAAAAIGATGTTIDSDTDYEQQTRGIADATVDAAAVDSTADAEAPRRYVCCAHVYMLNLQKAGHQQSLTTRIVSNMLT